jgi:hypothetical protein
MVCRLHLKFSVATNGNQQYGLLKRIGRGYRFWADHGVLGSNSLGHIECYSQTDSRPSSRLACPNLVSACEDGAGGGRLLSASQPSLEVRPSGA